MFGPGGGSAPPPFPLWVLNITACQSGIINTWSHPSYYLNNYDTLVADCYSSTNCCTTTVLPTVE